ncbi:unnamed protein product [Rhizoctonia solani]|uniref:glutathione transferase n=1 Tax=Rhizoctonia solani TaxID=456999 RepID=A0A8H3DSJ0_9AGAM|nr:unnamed protein product [Rhizoctonia solani]CAE7095286.1 unnamed protein product [Rhizoctonia solani]CAE7117902.1 unnamed protein product [Rhizoctonia solani]
MVVKIYGMFISGCCKRVLTTCHELGVDYELIETSIPKGEHKNPEYIEKLHPFGAIPALVDEDGTQIYESRAICRYLVAKYSKDSTLLPSPSDPKTYGLFEQAASIEYSSFDPPAAGIYLEYLHARVENRAPDLAQVERDRNTLVAKLEAYERILSKQKYLAGDEFTLADLFHLPYAAGCEPYAPGIFDAQPNVKRWWTEISGREAWKAVAGHLAPAK